MGSKYLPSVFVGLLITALMAGCGSDDSLGSAHEVCLRPDGIDFGDQTVRTESIRTIAVTNCGGLPITGIEAAMIPVDGEELAPGVILPFAIEETEIPSPVGLSEHFQLSVRFWPTTVGPHEAQLSMKFPSVTADEAGVKTSVVGNGVPRNACDAIIDDASGAAFGQVRVGDSEEAEITIRNAGLKTCDLSGTRITEGFNDFAIVIPPPESLAAGDSATLTVAFEPSMAGDLTGTLALVAADRDPDSGVWLSTEVTAPLTGEGAIIAICELAANPATVIFPRATANAPTTASVASFELTNEGEAECTFVGFTVTDGADHFSITSSPAASDTLAGGASVTIELQFMPIEMGSLNGNAQVEAADVDVLDVPLVSFADPTPGCILDFDPNPLTFEVLAAGLSDTQDLIVTNDAVVECNVTDLAIAAGSGIDFEIVSDPLPLGVLGPGDSVPLQVRFTPQTGAVARGMLEAHIGNPEPTTLDLLGSGAMADFVLTPKETFFLWVTEGCASETLDVTVTNLGTVAGRIDTVGFSATTDPNFQIMTPIAPGTLVEAGAHLPIGVRLLGEMGIYGGNFGDLVVHSTGTFRPMVKSALYGETESLSDSTRIDVFLQTAEPSVDILFVVDNSGSMYWAQQSLAANFAAFISFFATQTAVNYQMGITSTDVTSSAIGGGPGYLVGPVMDRNTPNIQQEFVTQVNLGTDGDYDEQGLQAGGLAVTPPLADPSGPNAGFIRDQALLAVIYVSDEEDHSPGAVSDHVDKLLQTKGYRTDQIVTYAIAGDVPGGCPDAQSADRYLAMTLATTGGFFSICDPDWATNLSAIAWGIGDRLTNFELSRPPDLDTVVVLVTRGDGTVYEIPRYDPDGSPPQYNGWSVDPETNVVTFHGNAVPESNERIEVAYNAVCIDP